MRLNTRKTNGRVYVYFLESYRNSKTGKPLTRTIKSFGRLDDLLKKDPDIIQKLQAQVDEYNNKAQQEKFLEIDSYLKDFHKGTSMGSNPLPVKNYGICIYKTIWDELDLDTKLKQLQAKTKCEFDLANASFLMSALRCLNPDSKLATFDDKDNYILAFDKIKEQDMYKSLAILSKFKGEIEKHIFKKIGQLYKRTVSVALYDVTTFFFESVSADVLKAFGFSKDNKVNQVQVVLSLLIDDEGIPIGYDLFPGNTSEFSTMESMLKRLKRDYKIKEVVIVADRGLNSKSNLTKIKKMGFDYVMASKLRGATSRLMQEVFSDNGYEDFTDEDGTYFKSKIIPKTDVINMDGERIVLESNLAIMYSSKRAKKDKQDRERLVSKAQRLVDNPSQYKAELKKGGKSFVLVESESKLSLDEEKIAQQSQFDGYYGIVSSRENLSASEMSELYHKLWKIEESFRVMKTNLEARPCYVWTEPSIGGHFVVCYMALVLQRLLEYKLRLRGEQPSTERIQKTLREANVSVLEYEKKSVYLKMDTDVLHDRIRELFGLDKLFQCNSRSQMRDILRNKIA